MTTSKNLVDKYFKGKTILAKHQEERTFEDLEFLQEWLQEKSKLFQSLDRDGLCKITKQVTLQVIKTGQLVYQQEDFVENFYVILRGSVSLFHDPQFRLKQLAAQTAALTNEQVPQMLTTGGGHRKSIAVSAKPDRNRVSRSSMGVEVEKLSAGDFFGEEALLQKDDTSSLSVIANEYLEVLVVSTEVFEEKLLAHFEKELYEKALFLAKMDLFTNCCPYQIRQLALFMKERRFMHGECLFRQDMPFRHILIVKSGSVKLSVSNNCKPPQELVDRIEPPMDHLSEIFAEAKPTHYTRNRSFYSRRSSVYSQRGLTNDIQSRAKLLSRSVSVPPMAMKGLKTSHQPVKHKRRNTTKPLSQSKFMGFHLHAPKPESTVELCSLGPEDMLNHIETMCKVNHNIFNAVSSSDMVIYEINTFTFVQLLEKKIPRTLHYMVAKTTERVEAWKSRHSYIQLFNPLIEVLQQKKRKLEADRAYKEGKKKCTYTPEKLAYSAVRDLGKNLLTLNNDGKIISDTIQQIGGDAYGENADTPTITATSLSPLSSEKKNFTTLSSGMHLQYLPHLVNPVRKSGSLNKRQTSFDAPLPRNIPVHSNSHFTENLCQSLSSLCSTGQLGPSLSLHSHIETRLIGTETPNPFNDLQLPSRCKSASAYVEVNESSPSDEAVRIHRGISSAPPYISSKRTSSRASSVASCGEVSVTDNLEDVEFIANDVSRPKNSLTDPKQLDKEISNPKQCLDIKLPDTSSISLNTVDEMTMPEEYSRLWGFGQSKEFRDKATNSSKKQELTISGQHLQALGLKNIEPINRTFEDAMSPTKNARTTPQKGQPMPYRYSMTPSGHPLATKKALTHISLRKMTMEGNLDLIRICSGVPAVHVHDHQRKSVHKGAWMSRQTQRRVMKPRPPVNLAPSTLRPYYV